MMMISHFLIERAGRYSPASTIKPAIALFGIENNIIGWDFTLDDPGYFILPEDGRIYRGWKKGGHSSQS